MSQGPSSASVADRLRGRRGLLVVVVVALVVRVIYGFVFMSDYVAASDAYQYWELATSVSHGDGVSMQFPGLYDHPSAFRPPVYPVLLGSVMAVFGTSVVVGQVLNVVIGLVVVALAWEVTRRIGGQRAALVAGLAVALFPPLVANDLVLLTEPLSLALLLGAFLFLFDRNWIGAGAITGLLVLTRPSAQFLVLAFGAWLLWRAGWRRALGMVAVAALVVAPWVVRNWIQLGEPVLVTSNGFNLAAIYSPEARADDGFVDPTFDDRFEDFRFLGAFDEMAWSEALGRYGRDGLAEDPLYVLRVVERNAIGWFELDPAQNEWAERLDGRDLAVRDATLWTFYLVTVAGWAGLIIRWRDPRVALLAGTAVYFTVGSLVLVSPPRLRAPFDLISCIGLGLLVGWWNDRRRHVEDEPDRDREAAPAAERVDPSPEIRGPARP